VQRGKRELPLLPETDAIYPAEYSTFVEVRGLSEALCGLSRPVFFRGVCTVCAKLFLITQADTAVFGWKDASNCSSSAAWRGT